MALDFQGLYTEVIARGFDSLGDTAGLVRVKRWVNDANHRIENMEPWWFLQASTTGSSPVTVTDLGRIRTVLDGSNDNVLLPATSEYLLNVYGDLSTTGTAQYFYMVGGAITVFPVSTNTLTVSYLKSSADMSSNSDTPLIPDRYRMAIVEYAVAQGLRDKSNWAEAREAQAAGDEIVAQMREQQVLLTGGQFVAYYGGNEDD